MILVPTNKVEKIKYFSTLLGLIFIEITRGPLPCTFFTGLTVSSSPPGWSPSPSPGS